MAEEKVGFFKRLVNGLTKTRDSIVAGIDSIFSGYSNIDDDFYEEIEETLIMGDLGIQTTMSIVEDLRAKVKEQHIKEPEECKELLVSSIKAKYADFGSQWGKDYKRETVIYTMGSGANYGEMYSLAICLFMEMQWIHSNCIHSGEYFHGPFEVTDFDVPFVLVKGIGATRELDERAYNFCSKFSQKLAVIDEAEFDLTGIEPGVQEYVAPLLAGTVVREMIDSLAHERGHALSVRRYMWQMEY